MHAIPVAEQSTPFRLPRSRLVSCIAWLVLAIFGGAATSVEAQGQPRDFILDFQPEGTFAMIDHVVTGAMLTLEHRERIYGSANDFTVGATALGAYPLGELSARAELRILFLSLGATIGYRNDWRNLAFEAGDDQYCLQCDRGARRARDPLLGKSPGSDTYALAEAKATLYFPLNEHFVGTTSIAARYEDRRDRSYDWIYASIYDRGVITRWETLFFLKHPDWGGFGPYLQLLVLPRGDRHRTQLAYGFNAVTRLGLMRRDDLLFLTFLTRLGDSEYGQHNYFSPVRALLVYRMIFQL